MLEVNIKMDSTCECPEGRDDLYHCISCDACCFGWGTYGSKYDDYLSRGKCAECVMREDGMTLEEMVQITQ